MIPAYSPEARGRSERNFSTWQGRLPQELRLRQLGTLEAANRFLREDYIAEFNRRFQVAPRQRGNAFVPCRSRDLERIFSLQFERSVNRDNTVSFQNLSLQNRAGYHVRPTRIFINTRHAIRSRLRFPGFGNARPPRRTDPTENSKLPGACYEGPPVRADSVRSGADIVSIRTGRSPLARSPRHSVAHNPCLPVHVSQHGRGASSGDFDPPKL